VSLLGVAAARELAGQLRSDAMQALDGFDEGSKRLRQLADFIVLRQF
jgi:farnesyl diphosphate synthase